LRPQPGANCCWREGDIPSRSFAPFTERKESFVTFASKVSLLILWQKKTNGVTPLRLTYEPLRSILLLDSLPKQTIFNGWKVRDSGKIF
jgi:hypothetical protein